MYRVYYYLIQVMHFHLLPVKFESKNIKEQTLNIIKRHHISNSWSILELSHCLEGYLRFFQGTNFFSPFLRRRTSAFSITYSYQSTCNKHRQSRQHRLKGPQFLYAPSMRTDLRRHTPGLAHIATQCRVESFHGKPTWVNAKKQTGALRLALYAF